MDATHSEAVGLVEVRHWFSMLVFVHLHNELAFGPGSVEGKWHAGWFLLAGIAPTPIESRLPQRLA
jgi:hypothetical protein